MAIDIDASFYKTGTATIAANGTVVTGQGTQWISSIRAGDLFGTHVGDPVRILSVDSNTQITLAYPWKGPAQSAAAYEVQFTPYDTGYYPAVRQLLQTMASGNVESFANIPGIADTMAYFTGAGTMDRTGLTPFARTLLDDDNAETMLSTLGLTGDKIEQMALGSFGVYAPSSTDTNLNNLIAGDRGLYTWTAGGNGFPVNSGLWWVETQAIYNPASTTGVRQIATQYNPAGNNAVMYVRTRHSTTGVWGQWLCLTGGQFASNSNGSMYRYADGTQICFSPRLAMGTVGTQTGAYWRTDRYSWSFPASFVTGSVIVHANDDVSSDLFSGCTTNSSDTVAVINLNYYQNLTSNRYARAVAYGRWF